MHHCCMTKLAGEAKLGYPWCRHHQSRTWWTREFYWSTLQELYHQNPLKHAWPLTKFRIWRTLHSLQAAQQIVECPSPMPRLWTSSRHLGWSQSAAQLHLVWQRLGLYYSGRKNLVNLINLRDFLKLFKLSTSLLKEFPLRVERKLKQQPPNPISNRTRTRETCLVFFS